MAAQYKVLETHSDKLMEKQINELANDGFMPNGTLSVVFRPRKQSKSAEATYIEGDLVYTQLMVKW